MLDSLSLSLQYIYLSLPHSIAILEAQLRCYAAGLLNVNMLVYDQ